MADSRDPAQIRTVRCVRELAANPGTREARALHTIDFASAGLLFASAIPMARNALTKGFAIR
jgi:hypothetical protein